MTGADDLLRRAAEWAAADPDPAAAGQLRALVEGGETVALQQLFGGRLTFGTAGLRGPLRPGPDGMNVAVVRRAAAGVAVWVRTLRAEPQVVVGYDARHGSADFAADSCRVLSGAGVRAQLLPGPLPTPVLAFAVRRLGATAGVMVTASHNPAADNGYKVYGPDGRQIVAPTDARIESAIESAGAANALPLGPYEELASDIVEAYVAAVAALPRGPNRDVQVAYTPLHGVGGSALLAAFERAGFPRPVVEPAQAEPDPDFPTAPFPNPEEPGALDRVLALAAASPGIDLVIANDPDADRLAVACAGEVLTGDDVGVLLADHLLRTSPGPVATTVVSSTMLGRLAAARGVPYTETLTGFKWIMRAGDELHFGYEEALGYAVAPDLVADKDGISAALLMAELAADLKTRGATVLDRRDELAREFGVHLTAQISVRVDHVEDIGQLMERLRATRVSSLGGRDIVQVRDFLTAPGEFPVTDLVSYMLRGGRVVVRPSGTEPKLKAYLEIVEPPDADVTGRRRQARQALEALQRDVRSLLQAD